jgi:prepilin-type N-terminal cleavage/methylation domain-containing protein
MRRGFTIIELLVAMALIAVASDACVRIIGASNRVFRPEAQRAAATGGQAALLLDLGADLRGARGLSGGGSSLTVSGFPEVTYAWDDSRQATVRRGPAADTRAYPGVRASFLPAGRLVRVTLTAGPSTVTTAFCRRNP